VGGGIRVRPQDYIIYYTNKNTAHNQEQRNVTDYQNVHTRNTIFTQETNARAQVYMVYTLQYPNEYENHAS
jgi:hypothetical protein